MRALVVSHALVVPANQALICEMERLPDLEVAVVAPARWAASVGGATEFRRHEALRAPVLAKPVRFSGRMILHFYRSLSARELPWTPDVVYADEEAYSLAGYQSMRLARSVGAALVFRTNQNLLKRYPPPFAWTERAVYRYAAAALPCSRKCEEVLRAKGYGGATEVVGFGLDPEVSKPWPTEELRARLGIPPEAFVVGFMGRFTPEKGPMDVIEACHALQRDGADVYLLMIGAGPQDAELRARAESLPSGRAIFTGVVPHGRPAAEHLSCMDACVVPSRTTASWKEQFGRAIIEAMACGAPVVGSDSGNVGVLVEETGGGLVFPEGDVRALRDALRQLKADRGLARRLGEEGREYVTREYTFRKLAERTVAVFRQVRATGGTRSDRRSPRA
jgi:glycosyltransferase involved in cell wall biosynthesis